MKFIADLHIHSHYSLATSKKLLPEYLEYWARIKGINVVATGDCVHPKWLAELEQKLEPVGNGLYKLKNKYKLEESNKLKHKNIPDEVFFILTTEISNIYKKNNKVRKVHNLCFFPDIQTVKQFQKNLPAKANINSDGRPIIGMDSKYLFETLLNTSQNAHLIPAHIWTPWFSVLGSKSGFDSVEECYEDLTKYIYAVETGLSSDPAMNRTCSFLDNFKMVSNSDAHSLEKLGREANIFDAELSYNGIFDALKGDKGFIGTIEFFPNEGKYHYDGHRKCNICWTPEQTITHKAKCPICKKTVTQGVMTRVAELADRKKPIPSNFKSITSLPSVLSEILKVKNPASKKVQLEYLNLIQKLGSEFYILLDAELTQINIHGGEILSRGINNLRQGKVNIQNGFDGEFGKISVI